MQILVDTDLWKRAFAYMGPRAVIWVKQNKGKSGKCPVMSDCVIRLNQQNIEEGFFLKSLCRMEFRMRVKNGISRVPHQTDIELSIIKAAIDICGLSPAVCYNGRAVHRPVLLPSLAGSGEPEGDTGYGFVYFVRNGDLHKIGITGNLLRRMNEITPDEILNVVRCSNYKQLERELHLRFKEARLPQTEYFRLAPNQVELIHQLLIEMASF